MTSDPFPAPLIVTGANHPYARTLVQFLRSAERFGEHRRLKWIVFDLGLAKSEVAFIGRRFPWADLRTVEFSKYPPHVDVSRRSYAWKPILLEEAARGHAGPVFWFDSATVLKRPIAEPLASVARDGVWSLKGQTPLMGRADARVIQTFIAELNMPPEILHLPERVTGAIGFDTRHAVANAILQDWARLARDPRYILPDDPDPRHRWEQTLFTALLLSAAWRGDIQLGSEEVDISSIQPVSYLTTRNKLWAGWPLWSDAAARAWYRIWKAGDRAAMRADGFRRSRIEGLLGGWREHYTVRRGSGEVIRGPRLGYLADPFLWSWKGEGWLFAERFDYLCNKGRLVAINLATRREHPVRGEGVFGEIACHVSFPFLVEREGKLHMIPETSARRTVDLYQCADFPEGWRLRRRLLVDIDAADSMLVRKDGLDYLFTSVRDGEANRHLAIYVSRDVLSAPLEAHPVNRQRRYAADRFGTGRCGGFLGFDDRGRLLRFMQQSTHHYGEGGRWMEITELSPTAFSERPLETDELPAGFPCLPGSHHVSRGAGQFAWDLRDRARTWP
ncbi:MAG: hypothetical protein U1E16_07475 [Hyphomicrobiales bacterium]